MGWGAPQGSALVVRNSVQIVPNVSGQVIEVAAKPNTPLKAGDVLFRIDPAPFEFKLKELQAQVVAAKQKAEQLKADVAAATANVAALKAQLGYAQKRKDEIARLAQSNSATGFRLEDEQKQVDTLTAQLNAAQAQETSTQLALALQIEREYRGRARQRRTRQRAMGPRRDGRTRSGGWLRHQLGPAQRCARHQPAARTRDGFHRHVGDDHRHRDTADRRPLRRAGPGRRNHV